MPKNKKSLFSFFFGSVLVIIAVYAGLLLVAPQPAQAQLLSNACLVTGNCRFCDVVSVAVRLGQFLIAGAGGLALVVVVWGAIGLVTSAGNPEKITAGKKQIVGAFFGMGITLVAFQLVAFVITLFAVPSALQTFAGGSTKEFGAAASLTNFLTVPWWSICNEKDLIKEKGEGKIAESGAPTTANCLFWGDGTKCKEDGSQCCRGVCATPGVECSYKKNISVLVDNSMVGDVSKPGNAADYILNEQKIRSEYEAELGKNYVNKSACPPGFRYQDYPTKTCTSGCGCTTLFGLPPSVLEDLVELKENCESRYSVGNTCRILITGGTEAGHASHGVGLPIVDLDIPVDGQYRDNLSLYIIYANSTLSTQRRIQGYCSISGRQARYYFVDGNTIMDEYNHWHIIFGQERRPCR